MNKTRFTYWALALVALAFLTLSTFAQDAATVTAAADTASTAPDWLVTFLTSAVAKYPWLVLLFSAMGIMRGAIKPVMTMIHARVEATESKEDDAKLEKFESSKAWHWFTFGLDYVTSIKLKK